MNKRNSQADSPHTNPIDSLITAIIHQAIKDAQLEPERKKIPPVTSVANHRNHFVEVRRDKLDRCSAKEFLISDNCRAMCCFINVNYNWLRDRLKRAHILTRVEKFDTMY